MSTERADVSVYDRLVLARGSRRATARHRPAAPRADRLFRRSGIRAAAATGGCSRSCKAGSGRCVYVVPGLMGSQLCLRRLALFPTTCCGSTRRTSAGASSACLPCPAHWSWPVGPVLHGYLPLKLTLAAAGYTVRCFDYDWRRDISETGAVLARHLATEPARDLTVIGHSMGGLIARIALRSTSGPRIQRLVTLGTPHRGSYAPCWRCAACIHWYAAWRRSTMYTAPKRWRAMCSRVSNSLYQMLPLDGALDLIDSRNWPRTGPQPNATLLDRVPLLRLGGPMHASAPSPASATKPQSTSPVCTMISTIASTSTATAPCRRPVPRWTVAKPGIAMSRTTN